MPSNLFYCALHFSHLVSAATVAVVVVVNPIRETKNPNKYLICPFGAPMLRTLTTRVCVRSDIEWDIYSEEEHA